MLQTKKPLIEKQRRKRINDSLHELKRLVLEALHRDVSSILIPTVHDKVMTIDESHKTIKDKILSSQFDKKKPKKKPKKKTEKKKPEKYFITWKTIDAP